MTGMEYIEIRKAEDVTEEHIESACDMREGLYGDGPLPWDEVIDRLEESATDYHPGTDWGDDMESEAIKHLKKEVRARLRAR